MTKRLIITAALAVAAALPAPTAFAQGPLGQPQQTLNGPTTAEEGTGMPPETSVPESPESEEASPPAAVEQGVSTSPGAVVTGDPAPVAPTDGEGDDGGEEGSDGEEFTCGELADIADGAMSTARAAWKVEQVIGSFTDAYLGLSNNSASLWLDASQQLEERDCDENLDELLE